MEWPDWWEWELELSPHLEKRMVHRSFTEIDLRAMLENAEAYRRDIVDGRWLIETRHRRHPWHVIVEPERLESLLVVITAYSVDR